MKLSVACISSLLTTPTTVVTVTARLSVTNNDDNHSNNNEHHKQYQYNHPTVATTTYKTLADRLQVLYQPNKIRNNIDDDDTYNDADNHSSRMEKDKGTTTEVAAANFGNSNYNNKEECVPPVTISRTSSKLLDSGNLPLSSCSSSSKKKQICIHKNNSNSNSKNSNRNNSSSSSIEQKKTGFCTDINDIPVAYWDDHVSTPNAFSYKRGSLYWEDTGLTTTSTITTTTTTTFTSTITTTTTTTTSTSTTAAATTTTATLLMTTQCARNAGNQRITRGRK